MCDMLIVTFSDMATNDQAIVNPPASFRSALWKYYGFLAKDGTTDKSQNYLQNLHNQIEIIEIKKQ